MSLISHCQQLIQAYKEGKLGNMTMPEDAHPIFATDEERLVYFTLPMALNYQRNSYALRETATKTYNDIETKRVFDIKKSARASREQLLQALTKYKLALQPNKHIATWSTIAKTIDANRGTMEGLLVATTNDFLQLQKLLQITYKKGFPYLSGPKIFHYRSYILGEYCGMQLSHKQYIEIAPDTHVIQCSVRLGILTEIEATKLSREQISQRWRDALLGSGIDPIDMHSPLWFWSRNNFQYELY